MNFSGTKVGGKFSQAQRVLERMDSRPDAFHEASRNAHKVNEILLRNMSPSLHLRASVRVLYKKFAISISYALFFSLIPLEVSLRLQISRAAHEYAAVSLIVRKGQRKIARIFNYSRRAKSGETASFRRLRYSVRRLHLG